jgi:small subunit ribosomal protein S18
MPRQEKKYSGKIVDRNRCRFCRAKIKEVDFKDVETLRKLCTAQGKIFGRKRSGNCAKHQRSLKTAVKRARYMALLPYTG